MPVKAPSQQEGSVQLHLQETHILKAILEFLQTRGLHIAQLSLERETGVINGEFSDDVIFLRQLILDGQWDNALDFVEPLKSVEDFDFRTFRYNITKYKFFELLCVKLEHIEDQRASSRTTSEGSFHEVPRRRATCPEATSLGEVLHNVSCNGPFSLKIQRHSN